jgi:hypothetical protein
MHFRFKNNIKFLLMLGCITLALSSDVIGQTTYYSKATGNANNTATWGTNNDGTGTAPSSFGDGDIFIVRDGSSLTTNGTMTIDDNGIDDAGILRIATGGTLTASNAISFNSSSGTGTTFEIENGGRYVHSVTPSVNINSSILTATNTIFIDGSIFEMTVTGSHTNGAAASFANFTISNNATVTFTSTIVFISGVLTINSGSTLRFSSTGATSGLSDAGSFSTAGTGLLRVNGSTNNVPTGVSWSFQVNYERTAAGNQRIQPGTYINLDATGGNRDVAASANINISGTFTPGSGTYSLGSNSTFDFSSSSSTTIPSLSYQNLTISGTGTKSIGGTTTVNGIFNISSLSSALFDLSGQTLILNGDALLTTGRMIGTGLLRTASTTASNLPAGLTWTFPVNYDAAGSQTVQAGTYTDLNTSGGNRTVLAGAALNISGNFIPGAGTYTIGTTSTFNYTCNSCLSIPILPYENLTISGTGTKSISAPLTVNGTLNISNTSGFLNINGQTLTLNGDATLTNGKLIGSSSSNLVIAGASGAIASIGFSQTGTNNQLNRLTINRTTGGGAILQDDLNIVDRLILTSGNLNTNNHVLGLLSSGISSTARVDQVTGSISYGGSGGVRVERFIPSGFRSYRDLSSSVYTFASHINDNWQEDGNSPTWKRINVYI